jgi:oxygen-independent coproporphyrinogen-3 oxidase
VGVSSIRRPSGASGDRAGKGDQAAAATVAGWAEIARDELAAADAVGLYVHFPFCSVHCPYCDFAVDARADIPHDRYAEAIVAEVAARAPAFRGAGEAPGPRLVSIYFGGGTPGLWRVDALARVIAAGRAAFGAGGAVDEITVEANPGEVTAERAQGWRAAGVNRVSLGLQSLDDRHLAALGRNHDAAAGASAVSALRAAGISNLSLDLMFALPEQTLASWAATLDGALGLEPDHVSAYALTVERATPFGARARRGELVVPDGEVAAAMQEHARDRLAAAGLKQYEVSSYARAGRRAVHNSLYWSGAPYLGVGASASSFRPLAAGGGWRFSNPRATETYLRAVAAGGAAGPRPAHVERRTAADLENEAVWLALRTADGLDRARHAARFGADPIAGRERAVESCIAAGWLELSAATLRPSQAGLLFADEIATRLWR